MGASSPKMSNTTLTRIAEKIHMGKNLTQAELDQQLQIARELYGSELKFEKSASTLSSQQSILTELAKVYPDKYIKHL